ncbi:MAG TPA: TylF/MycF/NovP-related O-methyltransferase [Solirubrobacteraceae bacterium]|jgi:O-methyltransferase
MADPESDPFLPYLAAYRRQVPDWQHRAAEAQERRTIGEATETDPRLLYVNLLKRSLTGLTQAELMTATPRPQDGTVNVAPLSGELRERREYGADWPVEGQTMIGLDRLENIQRCIESVLDDEVPGDLIETGVWRGGATIFMRGVLKAYGVEDRTVWVADSFAGLPTPDPSLGIDDDDWFHKVDFLAVSLGQVRANFARYGLLDDQVRFLEGYFSDTLPTLRGHRWSVLRLDGDQYRSTMDALECLYSGLSPGGYAIIDDYGAVDACRQAVDEFRRKNLIDEPLEWIDWSGVYWRRRLPVD